VSYQTILQDIERKLDQRKALLNISGSDDYAKFKNLDFYRWDKPKDQQQGTFVNLVGLPKKNGIEHGFYDYEKEIIDYLERDEPAEPKNKHLYILKSAGLGITTFLLYYIGWKCTSSNTWSGGRVNLLTSPRLDLTIDLMNRFKRLFTERSLLQFDDKSTICNINNVRVECFPSHTGLKSMRGLTDVHAIICDESSFFDSSQSQEVIEILERYYAKSNPLIILCSTPSKVNDLMDIIRQQPEDKCFYHRMYLSYKTGLGKIYTSEEIEIQKKSLSFAKEYDLCFESGLDAIFNPADLEVVFSDKYDTSDAVCTMPEVTRWLGADPGAATSKFGLCVTQFKNGSSI